MMGSESKPSPAWGEVLDICPDLSVERKGRRASNLTIRR